MVLSLPLPYVSAVLQALLAALLLQRRGDARTIGFVALSACMALLVGLRWSFPHPYLWFAVALVSSVQAPLAWLCFDRPSGGATGAALPAYVSARAPFSTLCISRWLPWLAAALTAVLLWAGPAYWHGVELLLVAFYLGYGGALLGLGWGQHARFDALRLSQVPDLRRAAIWAGWALLFNGVLEGLIGLDYWLHAGRHAPVLVGVAHGLLLPLLLYGVWCAGRVFAPSDAVFAASSTPATARLPLSAAPADVSMATSVGTVDAANRAGESAESAADAVPLAANNGAAQETVVNHGTADNDAATIARLTELVQAHELFRDPDLSLIKLARRMGVPARELSAAVNRHCGQNVAQWVNAFRIAAACQQLASSDAPISVVMLDCGFFTKSNFNREFRRHTGLSPSAYRQQQMHDQANAVADEAEPSSPATPTVPKPF
ncbi:MAG: AraC family transcriptional regulator [Brachymonas sp.]|nr:AraC family transcriptional regulator [Brachymonas sp.]